MAKKQRTAAQKAATKRMLAGLKRSRRGIAKVSRSARKTVRTVKKARKSVKRAGKFFKLGKAFALRTAKRPLVESAIIQPAGAALAGGGYALFEAATLPLALRAQQKWRIPIVVSQIGAAWGLGMSRFRPLKAIGHAGISIEAYSMVQQSRVAVQVQNRVASMLNKVLRPVAIVEA